MDEQREKLLKYRHHKKLMDSDEEEKAEKRRKKKQMEEETEESLLMNMPVRAKIKNSDSVTVLNKEALADFKKTTQGSSDSD